MKLRTYSDGASRGNPGHSAIAYIIIDENGKILDEHSEYIGLKTNNQAEYSALISALEAAIKLQGIEIAHYMDSELVVKQLKGEYKVRDHQLKELWMSVQKLKKEFRIIAFTYLPRTNRFICKVDEMANQTLDKVK